MSFKVSICVVLSFLCFLGGLFHISVINKGRVKVSYLVDRSLSTIFISDDMIRNWIKNDVKQKKVDRFNIISFGCDFNQSREFLSNEEDFHIPSINDPLCSNLTSVLNNASNFNNIVVISDLKFSHSPNLVGINESYNIEFVKLDDYNYDTLKIVSWQIPNIVLNRTKVKNVVHIISKYNDVVELSVYYANRVKKYYKKVEENKDTYISFNIISKFPFRFMKINVRDISNNDRYVLNNTFVHRFTFADKIPTYVESNYADAIFEQNRTYLQPSSLESSSLLIIDTKNIQKALNLIKQFSNMKHIITFIDTFILSDLSTYEDLEKFLPIKLVSTKQKRIFFLIDISGSMNIIEESEKSNISGVAILDGITELLKSMVNIKNVYIYLFNDKFRRISFSNIEKLKAELSNIRFFGNTLILPVLKEIFEQLKDNDSIYIFSDTLVKDRVRELKQVIENIKKKGSKLFLFALGDKKGNLYKIFRKFRQKIFDFYNIDKMSLYKDIVEDVDKRSYIQEYAKIYSKHSEHYIFSVENILNTKLKKSGVNILHSDQKPFVAYSYKNNYIMSIILKNVGYFLRKNISIQEIFNSILAVIAQKEYSFIYPYYFDGRLIIYLGKSRRRFNNCNFLKLQSENNTIYLFKKSADTYESDLIHKISALNEDLELDICGEKNTVYLDRNFLRYSEIFRSVFVPQLYSNIVKFPQHSISKSEINNDNKDIIWFVMSFILLLIESIRKIL